MLKLGGIFVSRVFLCFSGRGWKGVGGKWGRSWDRVRGCVVGYAGWFVGRVGGEGW